MIKLLPPSVVSQIAAGEVVERPASIIKELVENSIDANATKIIVEIKNGGKSFISVIDNGDGILKEDLEKTILPHATSKITKINDLEKLYSFGFRGEALSSISSVSHVIIESKSKDEDCGNILTLDGGVIEIKPSSISAGTKITISDLFYSVPVRKKYLKSDQGEYGHILKFLTMQALSYPKIHFVFRSSDKEIFNLKQSENFKERAGDLLGKEFIEKCVPIFYEGEGMKVGGFISKPQESVKKNPIQYILVNNRVVKDFLIARAIMDGYSGLIMTGNKSEYILKIDIDPSMVDCNIHPRKLEVRFSDTQNVFRIIKNATSKALMNNETRPKIDFSFSEKDKSSTYVYEKVSDKLTKHVSDFGVVNKRETSSIPFSYSKSSENNSYKLNNIKNIQDDSFCEVGENVKILGQIKNSYIIVETEKGLLIVDQHAAHERINYEKLQNIFKNKNQDVQELLIPETIELSVVEYEIWKESQEFLGELGFKTEDFGGRTIVLQSVPIFHIKENHKKLLREIIQDFVEIDKNKSLEDICHDRMASMACRMSIMFGDSLDLSEQEKLVKDTLLLPYEYCPHGRPATMELTLEDLEKNFKRI